MNREQSLTAALRQSGQAADKLSVAVDKQEQLVEQLVEQENQGEECQNEEQDVAEQEEEEPWPDVVQLHQPPEHSQLLLAERTSCIAVRTYLRLCRLPFEEITSAHAEFMTQGGRLTGLPMLRLGQFQILAEFEPIVDHVKTTRPSKALGRWLSEEEHDDMRSMVNYVETVFTLAEIYFSYVDPVNYRLYTARRSGAGHPWLISLLRRFYKQRQAMRLLRVYDWHHFTLDQVLDEVSECCDALLDQLDEHEDGDTYSEGFLCGSQPCELDALVFGHVVGIINTPLPNRELSELLYSYPRLVAFCRRIDASLYGGKLLKERGDDSGSDSEEDSHEGTTVEEEEEQENDGENEQEKLEQENDGENEQEKLEQEQEQEQRQEPKQEQEEVQ